MKKIFRWTLLLTCIVTLTQACKKDYYVDGGLANPHYNGTIYDYLTEKKLYFDTIKQIVDLAGMKDMMTSDTITFFAPTDEVIRVAMNDLNAERYATLKDSVKISDLGPEVWRKFLNMYILKGKRVAGSFPRVSTENITAFPGINYIMQDGYILNIGLEYTSYNGVEAVGPRILVVTDVTFDPTNFRNNPKVRVVSSDIQPKNGVIHALSISHQFGFRRGEFTRIAGDYLK